MISDLWNCCKTSRAKYSILFLNICLKKVLNVFQKNFLGGSFSFIDGIATCKKFCPSFMIHHFTMNCIWMMLCLHELKFWCWPNGEASSIETFLSIRYCSHFPIRLFANGVISSKHLNSANKLVHLSRCATQDLYNTHTSDMKNTQSRSLPSLSFWLTFLSADLTWLDMYSLRLRFISENASLLALYVCSTTHGLTSFFTLWFVIELCILLCDWVIELCSVRLIDGVPSHNACAFYLD